MIQPGDTVTDPHAQLSMGDRIKATKGGTSVVGLFYAQTMSGRVIFQNEEQGQTPLFELKIALATGWTIELLERAKS